MHSVWKQHTKSHDNITSTLDRLTFHEQHQNCTNKDEQRSKCTDVKRSNLRRHSRTDIRTHDNTNRLRQRHHARVYKTDYHQVCCGRALNDQRNQQTDQNRANTILCCAFQNAFQLITEHISETGRHDRHTVQKQSDTAKEDKPIVYCHKFFTSYRNVPVLYLSNPISFR